MLEINNEWCHCNAVPELIRFDAFETQSHSYFRNETAVRELMRGLPRSLLIGNNA